MNTRVVPVSNTKVIIFFQLLSTLKEITEKNRKTRKINYRLHTITVTIERNT